ncbi:MAG: hypothetical protein ABIJ82_01935 [Patescibacteria group bacterium]|nr:hypothetical protein [Patescibacteria group bacterium]MBU1952687.1 hypothetical protein [Patescibacteria group bacterium]
MEPDPIAVCWAFAFILGALGLIVLGLVCIGILTNEGKNNENDKAGEMIEEAV